jgi:hypothetical protein
MRAVAGKSTAWSRRVASVRRASHKHKENDGSDINRDSPPIRAIEPLAPGYAATGVAPRRTAGLRAGADIHCDIKALHAQFEGMDQRGLLVTLVHRQVDQRRSPRPR